ncbi:hypothetical protein [Butyrivibrio sp. INlla21]|uniref:hypothetical protein n=1 Tax=Butyrivibrio sp. INlla21 TaxID=1520811 RepID=UPI0008ECB93F|nr:hypothetical protein [Butyrivibrio sp. INlla21]SFV03171.1 hypothetical protein SAMN02910342_03094 [Butyrivibrio sp. INlla21]
MLDKLKQFYDEIKTPTLFSIFVTACCYLSLMPIMSIAGISVCVLTYLLSYISAKKIKENMECVSAITDTWWKKALIFLLFIYFNLTIYGVVFLEDNGMDGFIFSPKLYIPLALIWIIPLFLGFLALVSKMISISKFEASGLPRKWKVLGGIFLMLNYGLWLYAFNPCISSPDSSVLFNQAHQMLTVPMDNWHPPFYAIVLSLMLKICDSASFIIVVQCVAFSILVVCLTDFLLKIGCRPIIAYSVYFIMGLSFNNVMQMVTLWKDIPYMISITLLTFLLAQLIMQKFDVDKLWHIKFILAMVFTSLFRQNGIMPTMAVSLFIIGITLIKKKYKFLISIACFVAIVLLIKGPVYSFYKVESKPGLKYLALANDILGTYYEGESSSEDVLIMVNKITDNDPDNFAYNPYYTKYSATALDSYSVPEFLKIYLDTFINHPRSMFIQIMRRNSVLWSIIKPAKEIASCVNYLGEMHVERCVYQYPKRVPNVFTDLFRKSTTGLTSNALVFIFAWRTAIYTLFLLGILLFAFIKKKVLSIIVFLPAIFNAISLYIASGWTDYRYYWPIAVMAIFIIPFMMIYFQTDNH